MFMFSERNIKQNEELTTFYVENDKEYFSRKNNLFMNYGFICDCKLCQIENESLEKYNEVKKKVSLYIEQLIDMSVYMFKYNINDYYLKHKEVNKFIEKNKDKLRNFEKGLLYYNLYYLWSDFETNYNYLKKALDCFEKETDLHFSEMIYYYLLKMYKMNYVYNNNLCDDIKKKIVKFFQESFGNKQNDYVETIIDEIIKINTSEGDPDIVLFRQKIFESFLYK